MEQKWFAYRSAKVRQHGKVIPSISAVCEHLREDSLVQFHADFAEAKLFAATLGWNETLASVRVFGVPCFETVCWGFVLTQANDGTVFIVSPIPLPHLDLHLEDEARMNSDTVVQAKEAMQGIERAPRPELNPRWDRSRKGNLWCKLNGSLVTVFKNKRGTGFNAIISGSEEVKPVFTRDFPDEQSCAAFAGDNYWKLTDEAGWNASQADQDNLTVTVI